MPFAFPSRVSVLTASVKRGRNLRGLCHVKCSFMFCKLSATSPSTPMKWRVKGEATVRVQSVRTD